MLLYENIITKVTVVLFLFLSPHKNLPMLEEKGSIFIHVVQICRAKA